MDKLCLPSIWHASHLARLFHDQGNNAGCFDERYPNTTDILDASEVKVNVPSSLLLQS